MNGEPLEWLSRLRAGERRALAQLLTFAESHREDHQRWLDRVFDAATVEDAPYVPAIRLGITGIPGAGKSTLIDALGTYWVEQGLRVAVLAVDPSSVFTGGSILGDKVRMPRLGNSDQAFIRPVPSRGALGGITMHLDDSARLCELAGYQRIVIETVGVGQSEVDVASLCDVLAMLVVPGTGDELQAMKRGITEVADVVVVNKIDREPESQVRALLAAYEDGVGLGEGHGARVVACSATSGQGIAQVADVVMLRAQRPSRTRADKREALFRRILEQAALLRYWNQVEGDAAFVGVLGDVRQERLTLRQAARRILARA